MSFDQLSPTAMFWSDHMLMLPRAMAGCSVIGELVPPRLASAWA